MNRNIFLALFVPAAGLASIVALLTADRRAVSLQIWLAAFVLAVAAATVGELRDTAPFAFRRRRALVYRKAAAAPVSSGGHRRLRSLEGLVLRSRDNPRTFEQQLQPQLIELATHHLRINHGVDIERDATRPVAALGELSWLIEPNPDRRTPTLDELDQFIDLLTTAPGDH